MSVSAAAAAAQVGRRKALAPLVVAVVGVGVVCVAAGDGLLI